MPRAVTGPMRGSALVADPEIERARTVARWMDKYGLDPLIGLVPGIGDVIGAAFGLYIVSIAARRGLSKAVIARMLLHLGIDMVAGALPVIGGVADFFSKAVDWAYLIGAIVAVGGLCALVSYGLVRLVRYL